MKALENTDSFRIENGNDFRLSDHATLLPGDVDKDGLKRSVEEDRALIIDLQEKLFAEGSRALLLIFQAMDASGKDSCVRHVLAGVDPQGVQCWSFKAPSDEERAHDFLWRHANAIPAVGHIGVHNRSHYEEVLVVKVHPEFVLGQHLPGITAEKDIDRAFWEARYASIREFEARLVQQGVVIMKFHLRMDKSAQRERLLERLDDPKKNWKFKLGDLRERERWDDYMRVYEEAIAATSSPSAPWYIVPANEQWETRAAVARLVREQLDRMDPRPPVLSAKAKADLEEGRKLLRAERP